MITGRRQLPLRRLAECWDYLRIPLNAEERHFRPGDVPYWGANSIQGYVDKALVNEEVVLIGEDGAPFFERDRPVAFHSVDPIWPNNHIHVLKPSLEVDARWLAYALNDVDYSLYVLGSTRDKLTQSALMRITLPTPPQPTQSAIADYLDRETARIDTLIEEQQRLIEMLRERRDSTWAAHVEEARRLGQTLSIRRVIESIVDGPFGSSLTSAHYSDEGARVIRLGNIGVNEFKDGDAAFIPLDYAEELEAHAVEQGDVVVAGLGDDKMPLGRAAVVPALGPAIVKADCYRLRPNKQVSAAYLAWVMSAPQTRSQIMLLARGSTRARLNTKVVQQVEVPLPDRSTQDALVAQSDAETVKIDRLVAEAQCFIGLARERRSALITAAVTGQIDVRETA